MVATVVLDRQLLTSIEQVWTTKKASSMVVKGNLNLWTRRSSEHREHPQPRLHWRLCIWLGQADHAAKSSDAFSPRVFGDISAQLGDGNQSGRKWRRAHMCAGWAASPSRDPAVCARMAESR